MSDNRLLAYYVYTHVRVCVLVTIRPPALQVVEPGGRPADWVHDCYIRTVYTNHGDYTYVYTATAPATVTATATTTTVLAAGGCVTPFAFAGSVGFFVCFFRRVFSWFFFPSVLFFFFARRTRLPAYTYAYAARANVVVTRGQDAVIRREVRIETEIKRRSKKKKIYKK